MLWGASSWIATVSNIFFHRLGMYLREAKRFLYELDHKYRNTYWRIGFFRAIWECSAATSFWETPQIHTIAGLKEYTLTQYPALPFLKNQTRPYTSLWVNSNKAVFLSPILIHPLLHVCQESRATTIARYNLTYAFGTYINFDLDIILCDESDSGVRYKNANSKNAAFAYLLVGVPLSSLWILC